MSHKISYRERGQGPNLLLLHGYGGTPIHWEGVAAQLSQNYRVIIPNLSHLYMGGEKVLFTVQVELLAQFLKHHFGEQKFFVAGLSYGGALAWALALRHPQLFERLALINPMVPHPVKGFTVKEIKYFFTVPMNVAAIALYLATPFGKVFLSKVGEIFRDEKNGQESRLHNLSGRRLLFVASLIHRFIWIVRNENWDYWQAQLPGSVVPTSLFYDNLDPLFQESAYAKFSKDFLIEKIELIEGYGHLASKSRPTEVANILNACFGAFEQDLIKPQKDDKKSAA